MVNWNPTPFLKPGVIHAWLFDLDHCGQDLLVWENTLSAEEVERSRRFRFEQDRLRFIIRRGILRQLLGIYTHLEPSSIEYQTSFYGKLSIPLQTLKFNLSSSQNRVVFAFTHDNEIGVDLENVHRLAEFVPLVQSWFSPTEQAGFLALPPEEQAESFFHIWTQKEAFVKAIGDGLAFPLQDFSVSTNPSEAGRLLSIHNGPDDASHWKIICHVPEAGWRAAVCVRDAAAFKIEWFMPDPVEFLSSLAAQKQ